MYIEIIREWADLAEDRINHRMLREWAVKYHKMINMITSGPLYLRFSIEDERDYVLFLLTWDGPRLTNVKLVHENLDDAYRIPVGTGSSS